jgi:pimeloyl-ACP methyl ester carboxylesterase
MISRLAAICVGALLSAVPATAASIHDPELVRPHFVELGGGRRMNITCLGRGSPTVVFESGSEGSILSWQKVQAPITALTRTCFYDRAGFGYSDPSPEPITAISVTDDLTRMLKAAHIEGPVVMVGHSIGGFYSLVAADRFPDRVAGLVLVDPGFAGQIDPRPPESLEVDRQHIRAGEAHLLECAALARQGRISLSDTRGCISYPAPNDPDETAYLTYIVTHANWYEAEYSQSRNFFLGDKGPSEDTLQAHRLERDLGALPIIVLSASAPPTRTYNASDQQKAQAEDWQSGHRRIAKRSTAGQWRLVDDSGHFIALDRPEAVIAAIREVVAEVRKAGPK